MCTGSALKLIDCEKTSCTVCSHETVGRGNQNSFLDSSLETRLGEQQPRPQGFSFKNGTSPGDEVVVLKTRCTLKCTPLKTVEETGSR